MLSPKRMHAKSLVDKDLLISKRSAINDKQSSRLDSNEKGWGYCGHGHRRHRSNVFYGRVGGWRRVMKLYSRPFVTDARTHASPTCSAVLPTRTQHLMLTLTTWCDATHRRASTNVCCTSVTIVSHLCPGNWRDFIAHRGMERAFAHHATPTATRGGSQCYRLGMFSNNAASRGTWSTLPVPRCVSLLMLSGVLHP